MKTPDEIYEDLCNIEKNERKFLVLKLMINDKLTYQDITECYVGWLSHIKEKISDDYQMLKGKVIDIWVEPKNRFKKLRDAMHYLIDKGQLNLLHEDVNSKIE
jgi:hypothetical protein